MLEDNSGLYRTHRSDDQQDPIPYHVTMTRGASFSAYTEDICNEIIGEVDMSPRHRYSDWR